jgi:hypothetical protein
MRSPTTLSAAIVLALPFFLAGQEAAFDIVVAGGTASGVAAAITAARQGMRVALVERTNRIGGMAVNGVSNTDTKIRDASCGIFEEFRVKVQAHYGNNPAAENGFKYEPKVALAVMRRLVGAEPNITTFLDTRTVGVLKTGTGVPALRGIVVQDRQGRRRDILASFVIDATDEADVAAWAGAQYRTGREARSPEEPHAGIIYLDRGGVTPRDKSVVHRYAILPGSTGAADPRIQGYSFLMIVKDYGPGPNTRPHVLKSPPPGYDPANYQHVSSWEKSWAMQSKLPLPGNKREINQYPYGVELPGENTGYLEGSEEVRAGIIERHKNHALGYLYYLQHVQGKREIGLADDEFEDNGNFPVQIYVRQGRRVLGHYVLNESDTHPSLRGDGERTPLVADAVAIGSFPIDVHPVQPKQSPEEPHNGEGELFLPETTTPFQVPYRCLVPLGVERLLVSQAISSTHIGYQGVRLEPIRMSLGMAAGHAAVLAMRTGQPAIAVDVAELQRRLLRSGAILYFYRDALPGWHYYEPVQKLALRGALPAFENYLFRPAQPLTRAHAAEAVVKALRIPVSVTATHFTDVAKKHPQYRYIETLYDARVLGSLAPRDSARFEPDAPITVAQLDAMLAQLTGRTPDPNASGQAITRGEAASRIAADFGN